MTPVLTWLLQTLLAFVLAWGFFHALDLTTFGGFNTVEELKKGNLAVGLVVAAVLHVLLGR